MKKTSVALVAALFSMTALSAPARADGDMIRLGIGLGAALLGEAMKGGGKGGQRQSGRQPRKGDTLIGRVGEEEPSRRNNGARVRNKVAPAAAAGAVALAALPDIGPLPEARPSDEEIAQLLSGPTPSVDGVDPNATTAAIADASAQQSATSTEGKSVAFGSVHLMEPVTDTFDDGSDGSELLVGEEVAADDRNGDFGTVWNRQRTAGTVFDENYVAWGDFPAATIEKIDNATAGGMTRSAAIVAHSDMAAPGKTKAQAAAELAQKGASEKAWADAQAKAQAAADAEAKRIADARAGEEKARQMAEAEAALKAQAEAERQKLEAAYPALAGKTAPIAEVPASVDTQSTTSSTQTDLQPEPKKASGNLDL